MLNIKMLGPTDTGTLDKVADDVFDDPLIESSCQQFLADPRHRLVVALDDDLVVGFVSAVIYLHPDKPAPELWINEVGVAPTHQGQGIGKALMKAMLDEARRAGCTEAWVLTERENAAAMSLYKAAGGEESRPDPTMFTFTL
ncbi:MAG: GNAT family N-acetyltransferase [Chloroflexota bacterium]|nr:GNAT family N-acetyltransferase [Chloroflexota bacterium]